MGDLRYFRTMSKKWDLLVLVLLFHLVLPCNVMAFWPTSHANYQRNGQTDEVGPLTPIIKWKFKGLDRYSEVVVGRDGVLYGSGRDTLYAIHENGKEKWHYQYQGGRVSIPAIGPDGTVYIVGVKEKAYLIALSGDSGKVKWKGEVGQYSLEDWLPPIAVASTGRVYVALGNTLSAFNPSGVKEWTYQLSPNPFGPTAPSLSLDEKTIYVYQRARGGLYAINHDGTLKWHDSSPYSTDFSSPAVAPDGIIYLLDSAEAKLHAITPGGKKKWTAHFPGKQVGASHAAIGKDGTVFVDIANSASNEGGALYAIDSKRGKVKWKFEIKRGYVGATIAVDGKGNLYFVAGDGNIYHLKPDGSLIWKYEVEGNPRFFYSYPAISDETLYVINEKAGVLFAIGEKSKELVK